MRLTHLTVTNFRNLDGVDIPLAGSPVVVGENRVGKSNLVHAIRLVLDPSLSNAARWLRREDFSDHLGDDPMASGTEIRVSLEVEDFGDDPGLMATLHHAVVSGNPLRARLTYRFGPRELEEDEEGLSAEAYGWSIYGGEDDEARRIPAELRSYLHHEHLGALRDAEGDLASWRRSPLRRLLEQAAQDADPEELELLREALERANAAVAELGSVKELARRVGEETGRLVGDLHALEPSLQQGELLAAQARVACSTSRCWSSNWLAGWRAARSNTRSSRSRSPKPICTRICSAGPSASCRRATAPSAPRS